MARAEKDKAENAAGESASNSNWRSGLTRTEDGGVRKNLHNACVTMRDHPALAGRLAYDEFNGCTWVLKPLPWDGAANRAWSEFDDIAATEWIQGFGVGIQVGSGIIREAAQRVAYENRFHPVLEYLEALEWDGAERISGWLTTYLGVTPSPLTDAIGQKFLISAVARVMRPGCKADHMPILEGKQGILKSTALRTLVGDAWFADQIADLGTKDSCQDLRGKWIIEISELSAIRQKEMERVKAYVSRPVDHYRPSYGHRSGDVPRQTVFCGTTNDTEYLADPTGARRFWPVTCADIDVTGLAGDRDQLWAEAVLAYHAGETWWLDDAVLREAAQEEQELRRVNDPWEAIIADWLDNPRKQPDRDGIRMPFDLDDGRITVTQILEHAIGQPGGRQTKNDQMRVGTVLRLFGWTKEHTRAGNIWSPPKAGVHAENEAESASEAAKGSHSDGVVTPGVHAETHGNPSVVNTVNTVNTFLAHTRNPDGSESENGGHGSHGIHSPADDTDNSGAADHGSRRSDNSSRAAACNENLNGQDSIVTTGIPGDPGLPPPSLAWNGSSFLDSLVEGEVVDLDDLDRMAPPDGAYVDDWSGFAEVDDWLSPGGHCMTRRPEFLLVLRPEPGVADPIRMLRLRCGHCCGPSACAASRSQPSRLPPQKRQEAKP